MKSNTTIKIGILCIICAATLITGCINSVADEINPPLTMQFDIDPFDIGEQGNPYILELDLMKNGTALMKTIGTEYDQPMGCTYIALADTGDSAIYSITFGGGQMVATLKDDHTATLAVEGYVFEGIWKPRTD